MSPHARRRQAAGLPAVIPLPVGVGAAGVGTQFPLTPLSPLEYPEGEKMYLPR